MLTQLPCGLVMIGPPCQTKCMQGRQKISKCMRNRHLCCVVGIAQGQKRAGCEVAESQRPGQIRRVGVVGIKSKQGIALQGQDLPRHAVKDLQTSALSWLAFEQITSCQKQALTQQC